MAQGRQDAPAAVQARAVELYGGGQSAPAIARELRVGENGVYELLHERGLVRPRSEAMQLVGRRRRWR